MRHVRSCAVIGLAGFQAFHVAGLRCARFGNFRNLQRGRTLDLVAVGERGIGRGRVGLAGSFLRQFGRFRIGAKIDEDDNLAGRRDVLEFLFLAGVAGRDALAAAARVQHLG